MSRWFAIAIALAACGKGDETTADKGGGKAGGGGDISADHVAAVNAAIPADLKGKIEFEAGTIIANEKRGTGYKLALPKGWKKGFMPGGLEPTDTEMGASKSLGRTKFTVGHNCDGECVKKDWAATSDKALFGQFAKAEGKVVKDDKRANGRTMVVEHKPSEHFPEKDVAVRVITAWWDPEASRYHTCMAELGTPAKGLAAAFEKACEKVVETK